MNPTSHVETLDWLHRYWQKNPDGLTWEPLFMLPPWLEVWHNNFASDLEPAVLVVRNNEAVAGIAPLIVRNGVASIIGSKDVCDYVDFIVAPGQEATLAAGLLEFLRDRKVASIDAGVMKPGANAASVLALVAQQSGGSITCQPEEVTLEKELPATWPDYLQSLGSKQRHEVKRKLRRLEEAGDISYHYVTEPADVPAFLEVFLKLFVESREDKARFLTPDMERFFRELVLTMAGAGLLRGSVLGLDGKTMAAVIAFDYNGTVYLYNSAYDPTESHLSVGVLSKALLIKDTIERGKKRFDFLKGAERYKYHLGGVEIQLQGCRVTLAP